MCFLWVWRRTERKDGVLDFSFGIAQQHRFHGATSTEQLQPSLHGCYRNSYDLVTITSCFVCLLLAFWTKFFCLLVTVSFFIKKKKGVALAVVLPTGCTNQLLLLCWNQLVHCWLAWAGMSCLSGAQLTSSVLVVVGFFWQWPTAK